MTIERPRFESVSLEEGLKWKASKDFIYEEKLDGVWEVTETHGCTICGERMKDGRFFAFDVVSYAGMPTLRLPLRERLWMLDQLLVGPWKGAPWIIPPDFLRPARGIGGEFLEAVLANGGEGVVAKDLNSRFGATWYKCKRQETHDLIVTEKAIGKMSIRLGTIDGQDRGWCPCFSEYENISVGEIVEVSAYALTKTGKLREPRFIRRRSDKSA